MDQLQASLHSEFAVHEVIWKTIPGISGIVQCLPSDPNASALMIWTMMSIGMMTMQYHRLKIKWYQIFPGQ